ncbi:MAG TPA: hypothetical protein VMC82_01625 [Thermoplasmata archaeon]|nr:hypothetical protein [Thermoplasmata archaeon]
MQTWQIVQARQGSDSFLGGFHARELAAREFPREDYRWVLAQLAPPVPARKGGGLRARLAGILRRFGTPGESETDPEASAERASA